MAETFTFTENNRLEILSEVLDPSTSEVTISAKWNNASVSQTLPSPNGPVILAFNDATFNFFWIRVSEEDLQAGAKVVKNYNF